MSDSLALVRFPDGEIFVAYYFGSVGAVVPPLSPLAGAAEVFAGGMEAALGRLADVDEAPIDSDDAEDVEIWVGDGGAGTWWTGRGSRRAGVLVDGTDPMGVEFTEMGNPDAPPPRDVRSGTPEWVPADWR